MSPRHECCVHVLGAKLIGISKRFCWFVAEVLAIRWWFWFGGNPVVVGLLACPCFWATKQRIRVRVEPLGIGGL